MFQIAMGMGKIEMAQATFDKMMTEVLDQPDAQAVMLAATQLARQQKPPLSFIFTDDEFASRVDYLTRASGGGLECAL